MPRSRASPVSPEAGRAFISSDSATGKSSRGNVGAGSTCSAGLRPERFGCLREKIRAATGRSKTERPVSAEFNPVLRGWGAYFRNGNSGKSSTRSTATSMSGWRSSPAGNMAERAETGPLVTPMSGSHGSGSTALPETYAGRQCMPVGERCRQAVCGRTACTV
ncbi:group II intron maturase-specific domain-containing protein [Streptomyces sp. WAC02707]|uniref:group II intron maturase-specific domain-containing protein n=1 Tax=Streptomyces sp. WAC02707 TaxID=2487417 RepID=UPI0037DD2873